MRSTIHLRPAPRHDPPFDDELAPQVWSPPRQQLALDWTVPAPPPAPAGVPRPPPPPGASGDARLAVRRFVHLCVEVLNGFRPAGHLRRLSLPATAAEVVDSGLAGAQWVGRLRKAKGGKAKGMRRPDPVIVLRVQLCEPRAGAIEAAIVLVTGDRTWALALRMELHEQSWVATTLCLI
ncbi:hypothetical protein FB565_007649 [Actinoplanes lutulentus]|uniref:Uncharacterized protein n=1 Tax=Actinoplanes lutulentus TaxID=1287878 RepID=A0A327ZN72_9ACTN|nr:Rv3235 family protein [Actinoplanes lutulentus]MBB2947878.1 hypothetical protein [Actinoplanes lutulentus]RAK40241.1 hypothetical protein B0I29_103273 [Actinoplanes lutulentus]